MSQRSWSVVLVILGVYTATLVGIEASTSHDYVRQFFTDIEGDVPFYAINTTLSVSLQWAAALLFVVCASTLGEGRENRERWWFYATQAAILAYTGFDDQFLVHEKVSWRLGIGGQDFWLLVPVASAEVILLATLGRRILPPEAWRHLAAAGVLFAVMMVIDVVAPSRMVLRLSLEDLSKTWAAFFLFRYGWMALSARLGTLVDRAEAPSRSEPVRLVAVR